MSAAMPRGWCPSLFEPMAAGDGFLVRVKPRVNGVSAAQLRELADAAAAYGSGQVELTNRGNFQLRGLSDETLPAFAGAVLSAGLASADPAVERRRNILVSPSARPAAMAVARQLEAWLESDDGLHALPGKFGFGVDEALADISVLQVQEQLMVALPGGYAAATPDPVAAVRALTHAFLRLADAGMARMAALVAARGAAALFAEAGLSTEILPSSDTPPQVGPMPGAFGLGLAFGVQNAVMLRDVARLAERFGNGCLRTTRARSLVVVGTGDGVSGIGAAAQALGYITEPGDIRLRIAACAGRPACPQAFSDTRAVAAGLAAHWAGPGVLHVSGCVKGCAAPGGAAVTLVAGRKNYDVVRNGRARDTPVAHGLSLDEAVEWMREKRLCR